MLARYISIRNECNTACVSSIPEAGPDTQLQHGPSVKGQWLSDSSITPYRDP